MKLLELSYKNILSYGNLLQTFKFEDTPQLVLVEGENGSGKSSIKEALTVSIYGRSAIRKMKDIPNWINKNAYTQIKFLTNSGDFIEIGRGIDPNFSDVKINGAQFNLPDKRKVDEFIEEEIVKIPFTVFCNTISLSFDDFKSFVNLSQADKRKIVDRIFGIDILTDMRTVVKEDLKQNRRELESVKSLIESRTQTLHSSVTQLDELKIRLSKKKEAKSDDLTLKIDQRKLYLAEVKSQYSSFKSTIDDVQKKINAVRNDNANIRASISDLNEKLELYQKNRCPHCLNDLTSESSVKTKDALISRKKVLDEKLPELSSTFTSLTEELNRTIDEQNLSKEEYFKINADVDQLLAELRNTIDSIESDETESIQTIIESLRNEVYDSTQTASSKEQEVNLFSTLDDLLSDTGIKKTLLDKIIPTLNARIFEISQRLEFKFQFEFDSDFNPIITYLGMQVSAESLSSGQRKKMNLIVLLAFIEIIKMKHSQMNVMFLDEIFSSLDKNNVYKAIEILKEYAERYNMTIFVVSHEALPEEFFNAKILVESSNHFSEMRVVKVQSTVTHK